MPLVNIKVADDGATKQQKEELIAGATQLLVDVLGKDPSSAIVIIEEVSTDNWGVGGKQVTELRKQAKN